MDRKPRTVNSASPHASAPGSAGASIFPPLVRDLQPQNLDSGRNIRTPGFMSKFQFLETTSSQSPVEHFPGRVVYNPSSFASSHDLLQKVAFPENAETLKLANGIPSLPDKTKPSPRSHSISPNALRFRSRARSGAMEPSIFPDLISSVSASASAPTPTITRHSSIVAKKPPHFGPMSASSCLIPQKKDHSGFLEINPASGTNPRVPYTHHEGGVQLSDDFSTSGLKHSASSDSLSVSAAVGFSSLSELLNREPRELQIAHSMHIESRPEQVLPQPPPPPIASEPLSPARQILAKQGVGRTPSPRAKEQPEPFTTKQQQAPPPPPSGVAFSGPLAAAAKRPIPVPAPQNGIPYRPRASLPKLGKSAGAYISPRRNYTPERWDVQTRGSDATRLTTAPFLMEDEYEYVGICISYDASES